MVRTWSPRDRQQYRGDIDIGRVPSRRLSDFDIEVTNVQIEDNGIREYILLSMVS